MPRRSRASGHSRLGALILSLAAAAPASTSPYVGTGSCAARACHGAGAPTTASPVRRDEYVLWSTRDPHRRAYQALLSPRGTAIARRLGLVDARTREPWPKTAEGRRACLGCHALVPDDVAGTAREDDWLADGVGCEACHGPAGGWVRTHTAATRPESFRAGMVETMVPARAAEVCVGCHLGSASRRVDHRLLAAGHPPLLFDLDYFAHNMPRHWTVHPGNAAWGTAAPTLAGGAVAAKTRATLAASGGRDRGWPEFSQFECEACHHDYGAGREPSTAAGIVTGQPPRDTSAATVLAIAARPGAPLEKARALVASAPYLAARGHLTALHAYWTVDGLVRADRVQRERLPPDLERALTRLECDVRRPAAYDPDRFARHLRALGPLLR